MSTEQTSYEEVSFHAHRLKLAAKRWNKGAQHKVIALHGWLDNCGSFDLLCEHIKDIDFVALDSAGHGKSDFRSQDGQYLIWSELSELFAVADQLGWETFNLLGHSRGAGIAAICAGTFPERIAKLILIEGGIPLPMEPEEVPQNLANHILDDQRLSGTKGTLFKTRAEAITARAKGFTKIYESSAEILAKRALFKEENGFRWHADARLKAPSSLKLTHAQIDAFLKRISAPTLFIEGDKGIVMKMPFAESHLQKIKAVKRIILEGGHHLHMEESTQQCAIQLEAFIEE